MLCLISAGQQNDSVMCVYIYIYFLIFFSTMSYYRILNILPYTMQWDLVAYTFYIQ